MTTVVVAPRASRDIGDILEYLAVAAGLPVAARYERDLDALISKLIDFPEIGSPRPSLGRGIRSGFVDPYVVLYRFVPRHDRLDIVRVLHGSRDISRRLLGTGSSST